MAKQIYIIFHNGYYKQLLPNQSDNSLTVLHNAAYHFVQKNGRPTSATLKKDTVMQLQ
jgi:hypothetical protein